MNPFKSSLDRSDFFSWSVILLILWLLATFGTFGVTPETAGNFLYYLILGAIGLLVVFTLLILVRRLQNIGWSSWFAIIFVFPFIWPILFFIPTGTRSRRKSH